MFVSISIGIVMRAKSARSIRRNLLPRQFSGYHDVSIREMHGKPYRWRIGRGPVDAVTTQRCYLQPVAGAQAAGFAFVLEAKQRFAADQQDPFGIGLVVPESWWARLAG